MDNLAVMDAYKNESEEKAVAGRKLKVGIIGCGWIAEAHAASYLDMDDVEIVAGADLIEGKAQKFFEKMGIQGARCYADHTALLKNEKLDAVSICTYNATHAECAVAALEAGVNVLLEKPMCVTLDEAVKIVRAEKKSGKLLSIGFQPRFDANMKKMKEIVESGVLGKVYYIQTGGGRRRGIPTPFGTSFIEKETAGIGALGDIGCYSLDMVLNAIGYPKPLTVSGYKSAYFGKDPKTFPAHPEYASVFGVDDFAAAFVRLEGGTVLDFRISWAMNMDTPGDTILLGTEAGLRIPSTECWNGSVGGAMKLYRHIAGLPTVTEIPIVENKGKDIFYKKVRAFVEAVQTGAPAPVSSAQILYNQAILDGIVRSAEAGGEVRIEIPAL